MKNLRVLCLEKPEDIRARFRLPAGIVEIGGINAMQIKAGVHKRPASSAPGFASNL